MYRSISKHLPLAAGTLGFWLGAGEGGGLDAECAGEPVAVGLDDCGDDGPGDAFDLGHDAVLFGEGRHWHRKLNRSDHCSTPMTGISCCRGIFPPVSASSANAPASRRR